MYTTDGQTFIAPVDGGAPAKLIDGFFRGDWIARADGKARWQLRSNRIDNDRAFAVHRTRVRPHLILLDGFLPKP